MGQSVSRRLEASIHSSYEELSSHVEPLTISSTDPVKLKTRLIWTKAHSRIFAKLSFNIIRETCSYFETDPKLITVIDRMLCLFDVKTLKLQKLFCLEESAFNFRYTSCLIIGNNKFCICEYVGRNGDLEEETNAYVYEFSSLVQKCRMEIARFNYGIIYHPQMNTIYAFGGSTREQYSSEKLTLSSPQWTRLPDMHRARSWFTPCIHSSIIYLCGGDLNPAVETYSPLTNTFTLLPEFDLGSNANPCISIVDDDTLVVISYLRILKWNLRTRLMSFTKELPLRDVWSKCPPVVWEGFVYAVQQHELDPTSTLTFSLQSDLIPIEELFIDVYALSDGLCVKKIPLDTQGRKA